MFQVPKVTALVPTFNGEAFLQATLDSLAALDYPNLQIFISDDCSTDHSHLICKNVADRDARFQLIQQRKRLGWVGNCNRLMEMADGDFVFFAAQDDLLEPSFVRELLECFHQSPKAVLAFSRVASFGMYDRIWSPYSGFALSGGLLRRSLACIFWPEWIPFRGIVKLNAMRSAGPLIGCRVGEFGADVRWLFRVLLQGPFVQTQQILCWKRFHLNALHESWSYNNSDWRAHTTALLPHILSSKLNAVQKSILLSAVMFRTFTYFVPTKKEFRRLAKYVIRNATKRKHFSG